MNSYKEAFSLYLDGEEVVSLLEEADQRVRLAVRTVWAHTPGRVTFDLFVPKVEAYRYDWDEGLFGHVITMPSPRSTQARAPRFCHPRLRSAVAEQIATAAPWERRDLFRATTEWQWRWDNWYCRVWEATYQAILGLTIRQVYPTKAVVNSALQRAISQLVSGAPGQSGLPLTDEALICRQGFEIELAYPDILSDNWLYEQIKLKFLEFVDPFTDVLMTGKNDVGRLVMRVHPEAPRSHVTGRPLTEFARVLNPLIHLANPVRVEREDRSCQWLELKEPIPPPLSTPGICLPPAFQRRVTTLNLAVVDLIGKNVHIAGYWEADRFEGVKLDDEIALDGLITTPSGKRKLVAKSRKSDLLSYDEFMPQLEELKQLPGFRFEEIAELHEIMSDGTPLFTHSYRYWEEVELRFRHDKAKLLVGGVKAVSRDAPQFFVRVKGKLVKVDMIVAEKTVISKGARDLLIYQQAANAGLTVIDPAWSEQELERRILEGLEREGLPLDGRYSLLVEVYEPWIGSRRLDPEMVEGLQMLGGTVEMRSRLVPIGACIFGPVPVVRAEETEYRQSSYGRGVSFNIHARNCVAAELIDLKGTNERMTDLGRFYYDYEEARLW